MSQNSTENGTDLTCDHCGRPVELRWRRGSEFAVFVHTGLPFKRHTCGRDDSGEFYRDASGIPAFAAVDGVSSFGAQR